MLLDTHSNLFDMQMKVYQLSYLLKYGGKDTMWSETHADNALYRS
jgi:hypothetical protein